jgi:hypothetical protein
MMWLADATGVLAAASYVVFILHGSGASALWAAAIFGEVTKAWSGARWCRRSLGRPMSSDQRWHVAFGYTLGITGLGLALVTAAAMWPRVAEPSGAHFLLDAAAATLGRGWFVFATVIAAAVAGIVLLRYLLLSLLAPRR